MMKPRKEDRPMAKPPHIEVRKVLSRIKSVRDVHVARSAKVAHECRWAPGHVGAEYGGGAHAALLPTMCGGGSRRTTRVRSSASPSVGTDSLDVERPHPAPRDPPGCRSRSAARPPWRAWGSPSSSTRLHYRIASDNRPLTKNIFARNLHRGAWGFRDWGSFESKGGFLI